MTNLIAVEATLRTIPTSVVPAAVEIPVTAIPEATPGASPIPKTSTVAAIPAVPLGELHLKLFAQKLLLVHSKLSKEEFKREWIN